MNKYGIAEQAIKILYPQTFKDAKTTIPQIAAYVGQARDRIIRRTVWDMFSAGENVVPYQYITPYEDVEVKYDTKRKKFYANLPAKIVDLPNNMGINHVGCMDEPETGFIPSDFGFASVSIYGGIGLRSYYPERDRIYLSGVDSQDERLFMRLVTSGQDIGMLDDFSFPTDQEADLVQETLNLFLMQKQIPVDTLNNKRPDPA